MAQTPDTRPAELSAELARIGAEADALEREGKLDQAALARFDARMRKLHERSEREIDARLQARMAQVERLPVVPAAARSAPWWVWAPLFAFMVLLAVGVLLEVHGPGMRFVAAAGHQYKDDAVPIVLWLTPVLWLLAFCARRYVRRLSPHLPAVPLQSVLASALCFAGMAAAVPPALYGWAALAGWAVGERRAGIDAVLVSVGEPSLSSRGCKQDGVLRIGSAESRICVAGLHTAPPKYSQHAPQPVLLNGKVSRFGTLVEGIQPDAAGLRASSAAMPGRLE